MRRATGQNENAKWRLFCIIRELDKRRFLCEKKIALQHFSLFTVLNFVHYKHVIKLCFKTDGRGRYLKHTKVLFIHEVYSIELCKKY